MIALAYLHSLKKYCFQILIRVWLFSAYKPLQTYFVPVLCFFFGSTSNIIIDLLIGPDFSK